MDLLLTLVDALRKVTCFLYWKIFLLVVITIQREQMTSEEAKQTGKIVSQKNIFLDRKIKNVVIAPLCR